MFVQYGQFRSHHGTDRVRATLACPGDDPGAMGADPKHRCFWMGCRVPDQVRDSKAGSCPGEGAFLSAMSNPPTAIGLGL